MIPTLQLLLDSLANRNALGVGDALTFERIKNPARWRGLVGQWMRALVRKASQKCFLVEGEPGVDSSENRCFVGSVQVGT